MIIEELATTVVSNLSEGKVFEMGISKAGLARVLSSLTNLYNDPKLAVCREYFTNAIDSHRRSGQTAPVEVSLPTSYNKMYVVQDFGTGMSVDDIENVYRYYGETTKGGTNEEIGVFGYGAKSALAIANQFTMVTIKDGIKATVLIQKSELGVPKIFVASEIATDEANGVTISVPIDDPYSFNNKARDFYRFVDPSLVMVDGFPPVSVFDSVTKLEDIDVPGVEVYVDMDNRYGTSYLVMGQVAYALTTSNIEESAERLGLTSTYELRSMPVYFKVGIGDVTLTPNREGLLFDEKTNTLIDSVIGAYMESIKKAAQEEIDAIENRADVYPVATRWRERLGGMMMTWRGDEIRTEIKTATPSSTIKRTSWGKSSHGTSYSLRLDETNGYQKIIVTGKPFDKYRRISNYISDYLDLTGHSSVKLYFREALDELDNEWVTDSHRIIFEDFEDMIQRVKDHRKAQRAAARALLPKALRERPAKLEYPLLSVDDGTLTRTAYDEIPDGTFYIDADDLSNHLNFRDLFEGKGHPSDYVVSSLKRIVGEGAYVAFIAKSRSVESFKARLKNAEVTNLKDMAADVQDRVNELMTPEVLKFRNFSVSRHANRRLMQFSPESIAQILDEEVRNLLAPVDDSVREQSDEAVSLWQAMHRFGFMGVEVNIPVMTEAFEEFDTAARYPLTEHLPFRASQLEQEHTVRYMNMVYEAQLTLVDA